MPRIYGNAESVEALATTLIPTSHPELATARIRYVFVDKASMKNGLPVPGKVRKVSGVMEFLLESDFMMEVALDVWNDQDEATRAASIDHLLECCTGEESDEEGGDGTMKWSMREPDVHEFASILRRHGAWNESLVGFTSVAKQINVEALVAEVEEEVVQGQT